MLFLFLNGTPLTTCLLYLVILIFSATIHEIAHGYVALKLGDPTARNMGRLTLDPRVHLTQSGLLAMLFLPIGWANPVPINTRNFKNPHTGSILVSLAGPMSNFVLAFVCAIIYQKILFRLNIPLALGSSLKTLFFSMIYINVCLMVFNLIPFPPLDGSKIFLSFFPWRIQEAIYRFERYGILVLYLLLQVFGSVFNALINGVLSIIYMGVSLLPF